MEQNILLSIQYDGTNFSGWQRQPGIRTVQGTIEDVIGAVLNQEVNIRGVSRTDSGVHCSKQKQVFQLEFLPQHKTVPFADERALLNLCDLHLVCLPLD